MSKLFSPSPPFSERQLVLPDLWAASRQIGLAIAFLLLLSVPHAQAQIQVTSERVMLSEASPGETIEGTIDLYNETDERHEAKVYMRDYLFHADGRNQMPSPGTFPRSLAPWTTLETDIVAVSPGETYPFRYRIRVPSTPDSLDGSYWTVVMVEPILKGSAESSLGPRDAQSPGVQVTQRFRYGIQLVTHINDTGEKKLTIPSAELVQTEEGARLDVVYQNTGTRAFQPKMWLEIYDAAGTQVETIEGLSPVLYPGASAKNQLGLPNLEAGPYTALVIFDGGPDALFGAQVDFEL